MATKITFITADTLDDLEFAINDFFDQHADDERALVELVGGVSYANGMYVAPVRLYLPHKRRFEDGEGC